MYSGCGLINNILKLILLEIRRVFKNKNIDNEFPERMIRMRQNVVRQRDKIIERLLSDQSHDGSWEYPFETGVLTDCYMIILLRTLEENDESLIQSLVNRIIKEQYNDGTWKLFVDEGKGNLSLTITAYYALLLSGYVDKNSSNLIKAKEFIIINGGLQKANMFTLALLSLTGQIEWDSPFPIPVEAVLLPEKFPINFFDISVFGRANLAPLLIVADYKLVVKPVNSPILADLKIRKTNDKDKFTDETRSIFDFIEQGIEQIVELKEDVHEKALEYLEQYLNDHIEPDGTLYSYFSGTFYMIFAFIARGKNKNDSKIIKAIDGLKSMICTINGDKHCQYTTANVWNTALISSALQFAGIPHTEVNIRQANNYLLEKQQVKLGDWALHNPNIFPGGWGFSNVNTINPDIDDTIAALRALHQLVIEEPYYYNVWDRGIHWVLSMQNDDGGWAAFEKNVDNPLLNLLPYGEGLLLDASSVDLTGRTLEFLGNYTSINKDDVQIKKAIKWLIHHQEDDGSWNCRWGIYYIYGTWTAIQGLMAVGMRSNHPSIIRAKKWIEGIQNVDGGWGESCNSDKIKRYIPLGVSTLTHTAWALESLITIADEVTPSIQKGINFLINHADIKDWRVSYPKGQGMGGEFYIHYHSYEYIWPLFTLVKYLKKFKE